MLSTSINSCQDSVARAEIVDKEKSRKVRKGNPKTTKIAMELNKLEKFYDFMLDFKEISYSIHIFTRSSVCLFRLKIKRKIFSAF